MAVEDEDLDLDLDLDLDEGADHEEADVDEGQDDAGAEEGGDEDDAPAQGQGQGEDDEGRGRRQEEQVGSRREPSRRERRVSEATRRMREAEQRAEATERRMAEFERRITPQGPNEQQQFENRIANLPEWEQQAARAERREQMRDNEIRGLRMEMADNHDRTAFERLAVKNPAIDKVRDDVETTLRDIRSRGGNANREQVAYFVLGKQIAERAGRAAPKAQRRSAEARERQTTRPGSARSDASASGGRDTNSAAARERRLADMEL